MTVKTEVIGVIADITGVAANDINTDSSVENIEAWDSMAHVNIVLAIENRFGVTIPLEQAALLMSVAEICEYLDANGARGVGENAS